MASLFVGTSGYLYWPGNVYPPKTSSDNALRLYAQALSSVELNRTFYQLPRTSTVTKLQTLVPPRFTWSVKIWKRLSHEKKLIETEADWALFLSRVHPLVKSPGVLLLQLPKTFPFDLGRLENFLRLVPPDLRLAVEFRANPWFDPAIYRLFEKYRIALVGVGAPKVPCVLDVQTAPFTYYRLHGPRDWYKESYTLQEMDPFIKAAQKALQQGDVYVYFDNTIGAHAYRNAIDFYKAITG